jgi:hypothetical protein
VPPSGGGSAPPAGGQLRGLVEVLVGLVAGWVAGLGLDRPALGALPLAGGDLGLV